MKKFIILPMFALCAMAANAQDFDSKPTVTIDNEQEDLHFTVGARFMADAAGTTTTIRRCSLALRSLTPASVLR